MKPQARDGSSSCWPISDDAWTREGDASLEVFGDEFLADRWASAGVIAGWGFDLAR